MFFNETRRGLKQIADQLMIEFVKSLTDQGHKASGQLVSSFESKFIETDDTFTLEILFDDYGIYLDKGRAARTKRVPIDALMDWIVKRGIASTNKEVRSLAFAIQTKIFKEGIPTPGSLRYSSTGKRTGWFTDTIEKKEQFVLQRLEDLFGQDFELQFNNQIGKEAATIRPIQINLA